MDTSVGHIDDTYQLLVGKVYYHLLQNNCGFKDKFIHIDKQLQPCQSQSVNILNTPSGCAQLLIITNHLFKYFIYITFIIFTQFY